MSNAKLERIRRDPRFEQLCQSRSRLAWTLSAIVLIALPRLSSCWSPSAAHSSPTPLVAGRRHDLGIVVGIGVILIAILLTAVYVWKANTTFDDLTRGCSRRCR